jgi:hypothetical protein
MERTSVVADFVSLSFFITDSVNSWLSIQMAFASTACSFTNDNLYSSNIGIGAIMTFPTMLFSVRTVSPVLKSKLSERNWVNPVLLSFGINVKK